MGTGSVDEKFPLLYFNIIKCGVPTIPRAAASQFSRAPKLATIKAYLLKDDFHLFWKYESARNAGRFLDGWTITAIASRIPPMVKLVRTLDTHRELPLNWFQARGSLAMGRRIGRTNWQFSEFSLVERRGNRKMRAR